jgi:hypothetical protein
VAEGLTRALDALLADAYDAIPSKMKAAFDRRFTRTAGGLVRVWTEDDDVDDVGRMGREDGLAILEAYARPTIPVLAWDGGRFRVSYARETRLDATREQLVRLEFEKTTTSAMDEARILIRASTKQRETPAWAWLILIVLGWDQILWVLKHPALAGLAIGIGGMVLGLRQIGVLDLIVAAVRERLTEFLNGKLDDEEEEEAGEAPHATVVFTPNEVWREEDSPPDEARAAQQHEFVASAASSAVLGRPKRKRKARVGKRISADVRSLSARPIKNILPIDDPEDEKS